MSKATVHRRFVAWTEAELWRRLDRAVLECLGEPGAIGLVGGGVRAARVRVEEVRADAPSAVIMADRWRGGC